MKCAICDAELTEVQFNSDHGDIDPCMTCQSVIQDTLEGFLDKPFVSEDELPDYAPEIQYGLFYGENDNYE